MLLLFVMVVGALSRISNTSCLSGHFGNFVSILENISVDWFKHGYFGIIAFCAFTFVFVRNPEKFKELSFPMRFFMITSIVDHASFSQIFG